MNFKDFISHSQKCCICNKDMVISCKVAIIIEDLIGIQVAGMIYFYYENGKFLKDSFFGEYGFKMKMRKVYKSINKTFSVKNDPFPKIINIKKHIKNASIVAHYHNFCICSRGDAAENAHNNLSKMHEYESAPIFGKKEKMFVEYESFTLDGYKIINFCDAINQENEKTVIFGCDENNIITMPRYNLPIRPISYWEADDIDKFRHNIDKVILLS